MNNEKKAQAEHKEDLPPWICHVLPFVGWLFAMQMAGDPSGPGYTLRVLVGVVLLLWLKPWKTYRESLRSVLPHLPLALFCGVAIAVLWVLPEWPNWPATWHQNYALWGMQLPWETTKVEHEAIYTGIWLIPRILGAVIVIAVIEEFFWRGWMYRWAQTDDFLGVDPGRLDVRALLLSAAFFSLVHTRWIVAFICGIAYGLLYIKTRNIWAVVIAHAVTNLLLAVVVLNSGLHGFWA